LKIRPSLAAYVERRYPCANRILGTLSVQAHVPYEL
jgi:hypothetical protein